MEKAESKKSGSGKFFEIIADTFSKIVMLIGSICGEGFKHLPYSSQYFWIGVVNLSFFNFVLASKPPNLLADYMDAHHWPVFLQRFLLLKDHFPMRFGLFLFSTYMLVLFAFGLNDWIKNKMYQAKLDRLKIGGDLNAPKIVSVKHDDNGKTKLTIYSVGTGLDKYESKRSDLEAAMKQNIESISAEDGRPHIIKMSLSKTPLAQLIYFEEFENELKNEGEFIVGQSRQGLVVQNIADLPHLLIAGTSGGGKSVCFKQVLICFMQSTPFSKFCLLDFKKGVEFGAFSEIPGVKVVKTKDGALSSLKEIWDEMHARFDYLSAHKMTKLSTPTPNMPRIFVGIDEASELLAIPDRFNPEKSQILECRRLINDIAKLGRAASIHLIVATQKVSKQILETSLQENIGGRMAFRMATMANSVQVLGSKDAAELPDIKGRAIWQFGTKSIEVQVPYLEEKALAKKIKAIANFRANSKSETSQVSGPDIPCPITPNEKPVSVAPWIS